MSSNDSSVPSSRRSSAEMGDFICFRARFTAAYRACQDRVDLLDTFRPGVNHKPQLQEFVRELVSFSEGLPQRRLTGEYRVF